MHAAARQDAAFCASTVPFTVGFTKPGAMYRPRLMLCCLHTGLLAPEHSLKDEDQAGEQPAAARVYRSQSLGVSGGAPTALTGDTDMNGDMDYSSSSETGDLEGEEAMSNGEDSDEESEPFFSLAALCCALRTWRPSVAAACIPSPLRHEAPCSSFIIQRTIS